MENYKPLINTEAETMHMLHQRIHETFKNRGTNKGAWQKACKEFHSYQSQLNQLIDSVYETSSIQDPELIEFIISFLEVDPNFFRSGYIKEEMLRKIKRAKLTENQLIRLRTVLYSAVDHRGSREYKGYCRLASQIANPELIEWLENNSKGSNGAMKSRAKLMLNYIKKHNGT